MNQCIFSIIIPALNEEAYIEKCLGAIENLDFSKDHYEVILVDNGSRDATVTIAKEFEVRVLSKLGGTIGALRNYGSKNARGNILAFVDADCQIPKNWLRDALSHFDHVEVAAVGSRLIHEASSWVARGWSLMHSTRMEIGETDWLPSGNMLVSKEPFQAVNGFDEQLATSEDYDLCQRLRMKGYKIISDPKISSIHLDPPKTLLEFYRKEVWHGKEMLKSLSREKFKMSRALLYAIFCCVCIIGIVLGIAIDLSLHSSVFLVSFMLAFLIVPFLLALRTVLKTQSHKYLTGLTVMYMVYGVARSVSLVGIARRMTRRAS